MQTGGVDWIRLRVRGRDAQTNQPSHDNQGAEMFHEGTFSVSDTTDLRARSASSSVDKSCA